MIIKSIDDCRKCTFYITEKDYHGDSVICGRAGDVKVVVFVQPSFYNDGFKNGEMVVKCHADEYHV